MTGPELPELPESLKGIRHYLKIATEHDQRDLVVAYWCRLEALQKGLNISTKSVEETMFFMKLMDWLEKTKKANHDNEAITNDIVAQAHLENWALKLFLYADKNDRTGNFNKNVIQAFYTAGCLYDLLTTFGPLNEEAERNQKYAKWKAAYIYNCLKNGETPISGPLKKDDEEETGLDTNSELNVEEEDDNTNIEENKESNADLVNETEEAEDEREVEEIEPDEEPASVADVIDGEANISQPTPNRKSAFNFPSVPSGPSSSTAESGESNNQDSDIPSPVNPNLYNPAPTPTNGGSSYSFDRELTTKTEGGIELTPEQMLKAQKLIKWAGSALNYDDVPTAVSNLRKALHLLTTGQELA